MIDTAEIQLSLAAIWDYLGPRVVDIDLGPYPHEYIVIGAGVSKRRPGSTVEIARLDALAACKAWQAFTGGQRKALKDPRFGRVLGIIGYAMGQKSSLPPEQAMQFGEWLSRTLTGSEWTELQPETEQTMRDLQHVAKQAAFRAAALAVLNTLRETANPGPSADTRADPPATEVPSPHPMSTCRIKDVIDERKISWTLRGDDAYLSTRVQHICKFLDALKADAPCRAHKDSSVLL